MSILIIKKRLNSPLCKEYSETAATVQYYITPKVHHTTKKPLSIYATASL